MNTKENKGMCALVENGLYGDDDFELLNVLDLPDNLEGDGCIEDWSMNLGPIPADIFAEAPSVTRVSGGDSMDFLSMNAKESFKTQLKQHSSTFLDERKMYRIPKSFEAPSPDSVLERRISSAEKAKTIPLGPEVTIPVKARSNRSRPVSTSNSWSKSLLLVPLDKARKKRRLVSELPDSDDKKCTHCEITKTPQWREGPMGPKTLCNACGVRYRSGRLFPEYRPAASPTFIPSLHSNCHRKVIEIRQKGVGVDGRSFGKKPRTAISYPVGVGYGAFVKKPATTMPYPVGVGYGAGGFGKKLTATAMPYPAGVGDGVFVKKPTATPISYPVGVGDGVFVKKPATTMPYNVKVEDGGFVKKPTATAIPYSAGPEDGVFVKKPTATPISYPVGVGDGGFVKKPTAAAIPYSAGPEDGVFVKKPTATPLSYPVGVGDGVFVKKPATTMPYPVGAGDEDLVKKPTATAIPCPVGAGDEGFVNKPEITIPFPAGAGYGVFVNKPTGAIPTLTRLGSD